MLQTKYLYCEAPDIMPFILYTSPPFWIGEVLKFDSVDKMDDYIARVKANKKYLLAGEVRGYSILIIFRHALIEYDKKEFIIEVLQKLLQEMADFYMWRIDKKPNGFKRYKL